MSGENIALVKMVGFNRSQAIDNMLEAGVDRARAEEAVDNMIHAIHAEQALNQSLKGTREKQETTFVVDRRECHDRVGGRSGSHILALTGCHDFPDEPVPRSLPLALNLLSSLLSVVELSSGLNLPPSTSEQHREIGHLYSEHNSEVVSVKSPGQSICCARQCFASDISSSGHQASFSASRFHLTRSQPKRRLLPRQVPLP